jgi:hypothetical protein
MEKSIGIRRIGDSMVVKPLHRKPMNLETPTRCMVAIIWW